MEPVAPNLVSLALRNNGWETISGHSRILLGHGRNRPSLGVKILIYFLKCRFRGRRRICERPYAAFVVGTVHCARPGAHFVAGAALCAPLGADFVPGAALCEPPYADFVAHTALCEHSYADFVAGAAICSCRFRGRHSTL